TASSAQTIKLTNTGNASLTISSIAVSGANAADFAETNTCGSSVAAGASCTISITFVPAAGGNRTGSLTITDNAADSAESVALSGVAEDFQITPNIGAETVTAGQSGGFGLSIQAAGGLTQSIVFTCSGAPSESTCTLSPASVTPNGSAASVVQVTLSTTAPSMLGPRPRSSPPVTGAPNPYLAPPLVLALMM